MFQDQNPLNLAKFLQKYKEIESGFLTACKKKLQLGMKDSRKQDEHNAIWMNLGYYFEKFKLCSAIIINTVSVLTGKKCVFYYILCIRSIYGHF